MNLRINSHNSFCAKMIPEGFGIRSVDAKRWANIADLFEKDTIMYPGDRITIAKKDGYRSCCHLPYTLIVGNYEYNGCLNSNMKYKDFMQLSDEAIEKKFAKINELARKKQALINKCLEKFKDIKDLFYNSDSKDYASMHIYGDIKYATDIQFQSELEKNNILKYFSMNNGNLCKLNK